jgi:hypothetical protein
MSVPSIPTLQHYQFAFPIYNGNSVTVGSKIKELADGSETNMKRVQNSDVAHAAADYALEMAAYKEQHLSASQKAEEAKKQIDAPLKSKAIAITVLVAAILFTIGPIIAAVMTGTFAFALFALPSLIALVPASHYTHVFRKSVADLESDIAAPGKLRSPAKRVIAPYVAANDLDLRTSRISAINELSSKTLQEINKSRFSHSQILDYALLDSVTTPHHRAEFYSRALYLLQARKELDATQQGCTRGINTAYHIFLNQLKRWHSEQQFQISAEDATLKMEENRRLQNQISSRQGEPRPSTLRTVVSNIDLVVRRSLLEGRKQEFYTLHGRLNSEINAWQTQSLERVNNAYQSSVAQLENVYLQTKLAAQNRIAFTRF